MHISWLGTTAIKIQAKPFDEDITVVIDPYKPTAGVFPRSLTPHIALYTRGEAESITLSGNPFVLATPGECETKGILITAVNGDSPDRVFFRLDAEGMSLGHLGLTRASLSDAVREVLSDVDILMLPVGGGDGYDAETAATIVSNLEPRIVIPLAYRSDNDPKAAVVTDFLKAVGAGSQEAEKKVIVKKKDLPTEETKVIVLAKE